MLANIVRHLVDSFGSKLPFAFELAPITGALPSTKIAWPSIEEILKEGRVWACPKNQRNIFERWRRKYGNYLYKDGIKMFQPKRNIITCIECGNFHEAHAICKHCYSKIEEESKSIIESINKAWSYNVIDKEVQVLYQGEDVNNLTNQKRIVEQDRSRPMWFSPNLSQKSARPLDQIEGPPTDGQNRTVRFKD